MRRARVGRALLALLILWVMLLPRAMPTAAPTVAAGTSLGAGAPHPFGATANVEGAGVRFNLYGYKGTSLPVLSVTGSDGHDYTDLVSLPAREGDRISGRLSGGSGLGGLVVEELHFRWYSAGGVTEAEGNFLYRDARFDSLNWNISRSERLTVFHVNPLRPNDMALWNRGLDKAETLSGLSLPPGDSLSVILFPDKNTMTDWEGLGNLIEGEWYRNRVILYDNDDQSSRLIIAVHEFAHALGLVGYAPWFFEGSARTVEMLADRSFVKDGTTSHSATWSGMTVALRQLHDLAQQGPVDPTEARHFSPPPNDAYVTGAAVCLYIRRLYGDEGLRRFFREGAARGPEAAIEALTGHPIKRFWNDWNDYLRSDQVLEDVRNL